jgi:hypothetical protein
MQLRTLISLMVFYSFLWKFNSVEDLTQKEVITTAVGLRLVVFVSKVQSFYIQITAQTGWGEGREERGATPLTCCVG